ncbi:DNA topoisomerase 3 [Carnobacteriaceae bacterium zg-ZUI252]|nr:DNA topoisomerase 3 [Carnobacteriaceae bacterium zg-ZUI252]
MKKIVLAEKPSVAKDLAKVLHANQVHKHYFEGNAFIVTWAYGHLLTLQMPEDLATDWKEWKLETLPMLPKRIGTKPLPKTTGQLHAIKKLVHRSDVSHVVIATDAGREGELVARWILQYCKNDKPIERLWISSQTQKAIEQGFKSLKPGSQYNRLFDSALARSKADWLIGLNVTRALTVKYQDNLSAGRVQTPTLALVRQQEEKIEKFIPKTYFTVTLNYDGLTAKLPQQFHTKEEAQQLIETLSHGKVTQVSDTIKRQSAPLLYDLTKLQTDANHRYGFSAKKTLAIVQRLYEVYKVTSYPRTDSQYLTSDLKGTLLERLHAIVKVDERVKGIIKNGGKILQKQVFNDHKVGDHHALIPTEIAPNYAKMDSDDIKIYHMIVERFVEQFLPDVQTNKHSAIVAFNEIEMTLSTETILEKGWKLDGVATEKTVAFRVGQSIPKNFSIQQQLTTPPHALTEGSLLALMDKFHLGTPATRAEIIERLVSGELLQRDKLLKVTPKGKQLLTLVNPELKSPELTEKWEVQLEEIAQGKRALNAFVTEIEEQTKVLVRDIKQSEAVYKDFNLTGKKCPECASLLREKQTKQGAFYVCTSETCSYRRRKDLKVTNKRCSVCHKKMVQIDGKNGAYFKCQTCQISEKIENKSTKQKKVTKHEAKRLMQKINNDHIEVENPFAAALKNLK